MNALTKSFLIGAFVITLAGSLTMFGSCLNWCNEGERTLNAELGPKALNQKYEWFANAANEIKVQKQNIDNLRFRNEQLVFDLGPRSNWSRSTEDTYAQYQTELYGTIANYNRLVGEYNSEMSKCHTAPMNSDKQKFEFETSRLPQSFDKIEK
jgi:uncharacterized protein YukE